VLQLILEYLLHIGCHGIQLLNGLIKTTLVVIAHCFSRLFEQAVTRTLLRGLQQIAIERQREIATAGQ
jgi:hypothetical protein